MLGFFDFLSVLCVTVGAVIMFLAHTLERLCGANCTEEFVMGHILEIPAGGVVLFEKFGTHVVSMLLLITADLRTTFIEVFCTHHVFYLVFFILMSEIFIGFLYARPEMREMTSVVVAEVHTIAEPAGQGLRALWGVVTNPGKILAYMLVFLVVRYRPDAAKAIADATMKGTKFM